MFKVTIETDDRRITIEDFDLNEDSVVSDVVRICRDAILAMGYQEGSVEDYIPNF